LESLTANIGHINEIVSTQQNHARVSGLKEEVSLERLVEDALLMIHPGFERHEIQIRREYAELPAVVADKHRILQILLTAARNKEQPTPYGHILREVDELAHERWCSG
jgi:signal transduction histidine kinase